MGFHFLFMYFKEASEFTVYNNDFNLLFLPSAQRKRTCQTAFAW